MPRPVKVVLITDGDRCAQHAVESIASELGLRCISASGGNPTPISGEEIVHLLKEVPYDPVLVMFDDRGKPGKAQGETAMEYVANHPDVQVLGAVAVASNTTGIQGVKVDACVCGDGDLVASSVDKNGRVGVHKEDDEMIITGDTVDVLNDMEIPFIIGVGDIGKMKEADSIDKGAPVTRKAIEEVLKRSGVQYGRKTKN